MSVSSQAFSATGLVINYTLSPVFVLFMGAYKFRNKTRLVSLEDGYLDREERVCHQ